MLVSLLHLKLYLEITNLDGDSFAFETDGKGTLEVVL